MLSITYACSENCTLISVPWYFGKGGGSFKLVSKPQSVAPSTPLQHKLCLTGDEGCSSRLCAPGNRGNAGGKPAAYMFLVLLPAGRRALGKPQASDVQGC